MARSKFAPQFTAAIAVVHGKSEEIIVKHIASCLRLSIPVQSRTTSIQIDGLANYLISKINNIHKLTTNTHAQLNVKKGIILNDFKIFTFMDTDDCDLETKTKYLNKSLFRGYNLCNYVVPIYTSPNLEDVFYKSKLIPKRFSDKEKVDGYTKLFEVATVPKANKIKELSDKLRNNNNTNFEMFLDYCIEQSEKRIIK